jgi:hypothetical protein
MDKKSLHDLVWNIDFVESKREGEGRQRGYDDDTRFLCLQNKFKPVSVSLAYISTIINMRRER